MRHFEHFTRTKRLRLEQYLKQGKTPREIAIRLGFHISTIYREISRGAYSHKLPDWTFETRYAAELAHGKYRENLKAKGADLKIGNDRKLAEYIEHKIIKEHYSPSAVLLEIRCQGLEFDTAFCVSTLYSYIDKKIFLTLRNKHLPYGKQKSKNSKRRASRPPKGASIEQRPKEVDTRKSFGFWEMDTVKGKNNTKNTILVLTERKTRYEITARLPNNTTANVVKEIARIKRRHGKYFRNIFLNITVDNGSEFMDYEGMKRKGIKEVYYCHPYSSWERPSNENQNRMLRRWIKKGTPIENYTDAEIQHATDWLNNYPRRIFDGRTSAQLFQEEIDSIMAQAP